MPKNEETAPIFEGFRQQQGHFAFTMVPNQFLDEIVPHEKPCVVKVVCLVLRRTLGWVDEHGQRRQQDKVAYSEFAREMNMSRQSINQGLKAALEKGYIVRVKQGRMAGLEGNAEGASYSLHWSEETAEEQSKKQTEAKFATRSQRSKKQTEEAPGKDAEQSKKQTEEQSKKQTEEGAENSLKFRPIINKEYLKQTKVEIKAGNSTRQHSNLAGKYSAYIGNVITELGEQFDDAEHRLSNIKRALNLWDREAVSEKEFVGLLYQAREITRSTTSASSRPVQRADGSVAISQRKAGQPGRMAYFFRVLEELVGKPLEVDLPATFADPAPVIDLPASFAEPPLVAPETAAEADWSEQLFRTLGPSYRRSVVEPIAACANASVERDHWQTEPETLPCAVAQNCCLTRDEGRGMRDEQPDYALTTDNAEATCENPPSLGANPTTELSPTSLETHPSALTHQWAEAYSQDAAAVLSSWQQVVSGVAGPVHGAIAARTLGISAELATPELLTAVGLPSRRLLLANGFSPSQATSERVDIILFFRNEFDARYSMHHVGVLQEAARLVFGRPVQFFPACF